MSTDDTPDHESSRRLIYGEEPGGFEKLHAKVAAAIQPRDVFEEIYVDDYVTAQIMVETLRDWRTELINSDVAEGLRRVLQDLGVNDYHELAEAWLRGTKKSRNRVGDILASAGLTEKAIAAQTYASRDEIYERLTRLVHGEVRLREQSRDRLTSHRALETHRARLSPPASDVVEAEIVEDAPEMATP